MSGSKPTTWDRVSDAAVDEVSHMINGVGNGYQAFLTGAPIYMADRDNPELFSQETIEQAEMEEPDIEGPEIGIDLSEHEPEID